MTFTQLIIELIIGAIGGNAAGAVMKDKSLGTLGNTIAGVVGGGRALLLPGRPQGLYRPFLLQ